MIASKRGGGGGGGSHPTLLWGNHWPAHAGLERTNLSYRTFLSEFERNLPKMLTAKTLSPLSDWMSIMQSTVSYRMAWPTFLLESVFVATYRGGTTDDEYLSH